MAPLAHRLIITAKLHGGRILNRSLLSRTYATHYDTVHHFYKRKSCLEPANSPEFLISLAATIASLGMPTRLFILTARLDVDTVKAGV